MTSSSSCFSRFRYFCNCQTFVFLLEAISTRNCNARWFCIFEDELMEWPHIYTFSRQLKSYFIAIWKIPFAQLHCIVIVKFFMIGNVRRLLERGSLTQNITLVFSALKGGYSPKQQRNFSATLTLFTFSVLPDFFTPLHLNAVKF